MNVYTNVPSQLQRTKYNLELKEYIVYIPSMEVTDMTQNGANTEALSVAVVSMSTSESGDNTARSSFTYIGSRVLKGGRCPVYLQR